MAKARSIIGLDCDGVAHSAVTYVLSVRFEEMTSYREAATSPDGSVDGIHDMRVASRRFRSLLRDFSPLFRKKHLKPFKKGLRKLAQQLGVVRDVDVYLEKLRQVSEIAPSSNIKDGLDGLIAKSVVDRSSKHSSLGESFTPESLIKLNVMLDKAVSAESRKTKSFGAGNFRQFGRVVIGDLVDSLSNRGKSIMDPLNGDGLHRLRIAAKRLRYELEGFAICFGGQLRVYAKTLSELQNRLGAVHDLDVWSDGLGTGCEESPESTAIQWSKDEFQRERVEKYQAALELWNESIDPKLIADVRDIIST